MSAVICRRIVEAVFLGGAGPRLESAVAASHVNALRTDSWQFICTAS